MTTGEWIVVGMFVVGLVCSLSLFWWLRKLIRGENRNERRRASAQGDTR